MSDNKDIGIVVVSKNKDLKSAVEKAIRLRDRLKKQVTDGLSEDETKDFLLKRL